ncbi:hypothetical protein Ahy_A05g021836 isoform A [Arachis hypogaea]|uniref:Disease resistance protein RPS4B/Roq1-like leucine-rich repeats domain-containing protein n=1 Tax=Arachis hypogaea TaxID=3818 RepID=A0A445CYP0_ARAHY|nr:hypothetical protein Ahy_A05g021836 isoform A [Arachis hypogaea]
MIQGSDRVEVIILHSSKRRVNWNGKAFKKMRNLKVLIFWDNFNSLSFMDFGECEFLTEVPDLSGVPNLGALCLDNCRNLVKVHRSVGFLEKLILLSVQGCTKLRTLVDEINLPSLETLDLSGCTSLVCFPEIVATMENIRVIYLDSTAIYDLPLTMFNLVSLERLYLRNCRDLKSLQGCIRLLPKLEVVIFPKQRGFRLNSVVHGFEQKISSEFMIHHGPRPLVPWEACCTVSSDSNLIQSSHHWRRHISPEEERGAGSEGASSVSFRYRRKLPGVIGALFTTETTDIDTFGSVLEFRVLVLVNRSYMFSSSSVYVISETRRTQPLLVNVILRTLQGHGERYVFRSESESENEWNLVQIVGEMYFHRPCTEGEGKNTAVGAVMKRSSLVFDTEYCCMEDIQYSNGDTCESDALPGVTYIDSLTKESNLREQLYILYKPPYVGRTRILCELSSRHRSNSDVQCHRRSRDADSCKSRMFGRMRNDGGSSVEGVDARRRSTTVSVSRNRGYTSRKNRVVGCRLLRTRQGNREREFFCGTNNFGSRVTVGDEELM